MFPAVKTAGNNLRASQNISMGQFRAPGHTLDTPDPVSHLSCLFLVLNCHHIFAACLSCLVEIHHCHCIVFAFFICILFFLHADAVESCFHPVPIQQNHTILT